MELSWLSDRPKAESVTGFDAEGWEASIWVLHAMYENVSLPAGVTHNDEHQAGLASGLIQPTIINGTNLDDVTTVTGASLGYRARPDASCRRTRWSDYAARRGSALIAADQSVPPCYRWFPVGSWPVSIDPPPVGSLDEESLTALLDVVAEQSDHGHDTQCFAFYGSLPSGDFDHPTLLTGPLIEVTRLVVGEDAHQSTPSNIWPDDRSWFVWTDWDLSGTKVSGSKALIDAIRHRSELETITWPALG